jgi:hypothetical protein
LQSRTVAISTPPPPLHRADRRLPPRSGNLDLVDGVLKSIMVRKPCPGRRSGGNPRAKIRNLGARRHWYGQLFLDSGDVEWLPLLL